MARGKFEYWLGKDGLTLLEGWARDGLTDEQIANNCKISAATLYDWKKRFPEISEALKRGKEVVDYEVENALLQSALDGNTTAQIYWLKNRRPESWRDKPREVIVKSGIEEGIRALADILQNPAPDRDIREFEK